MTKSQLALDSLSHRKTSTFSVLTPQVITPRGGTVFQAGVDVVVQAKIAVRVRRVATVRGLTSR